MSNRKQWKRTARQTLKRTYLMTIMLQIVLLFLKHLYLVDSIAEIIDYNKINETSLSYIAKNMYLYFSDNWGIISFFYLFYIVLYLPTKVGYTRYILNTLSGKESVSDIIYGLEHRYLKSIATYILADFIIILGFLCFIIPGIILLYDYKLIGFIQAQMPKLSVKETLKTSRRMMKGKRWSIICLDISFIPLYILGIVTKNVSDIFLFDPYYNMTLACFYEDQKGVCGSADTEMEE